MLFLLGLASTQFLKEMECMQVATHASCTALWNNNKKDIKSECNILFVFIHVFFSSLSKALLSPWLMHPPPSNKNCQAKHQYLNRPTFFSSISDYRRLTVYEAGNAGNEGKSD